MSTASTVFMFSGQGSQYFQMGRALHDQVPVFRDWMLRLDGIASGLTGRSIIDVLYHDGRGKAEVFDRTLWSHPAIFMVEYALAQSLIHDGIQPDMVLGASLGSFAAAAVAGHIDVEEALHAVVAQASILERACPRGGMIAVLADVSLYQEAGLAQFCTLAGQNFPSHFVVSAQAQALDSVEAILRSRQATYQKLPVSFAFHSPGIDEAGGPFRSHLLGMTHRSGGLPLACCAHATTLHALPPDYFWTISREAIHFQKTIGHLESSGVHRYIDIGPSGTLATFLKYALPRSTLSRALKTIAPFGNDLVSLALLREEAGVPAQPPRAIPSP